VAGRQVPITEADADFGGLEKDQAKMLCSREMRCFSPPQVVDNKSTNSSPCRCSSAPHRKIAERSVNDVFHGLVLAGRHDDGAVVFVSGEFALHKHVRAFDETFRHLPGGSAKGDDIVPLTFHLPGACSPFQDFFVAMENFTTVVLFVKADNSDLVSRPMFKSTNYLERLCCCAVK
jgi:hypothetical protein